MTRPTIAGISYLNARPYFFPLMSGAVESGFDVHLATPTEANRRLISGQDVAGLVSSVEWIERRAAGVNDALVRIPGLEIASDGPVGSILLFSDRPWRELRAVAVTSESATSTRLLAVLFAMDGLAVTMRAAADPIGELERGHADGALLIGDAAISATPSPRERWDLGALWKAKTGMPMVYAVFAIRRDREELFENVATTVRSALRYSRDHLDEVVAPVASIFRAAAPRFDPVAYLREFDRMRDDARLGDGIEEFARLIAKCSV